MKPALLLGFKFAYYLHLYCVWTETLQNVVFRINSRTSRQASDDNDESRSKLSNDRDYVDEVSKIWISGLENADQCKGGKMWLNGWVGCKRFNLLMWELTEKADAAKKNKNYQWLRVIFLIRLKIMPARKGPRWFAC